MIVFQESYNAHGIFERRLFLNGKTYVEIAKWSERRKSYINRPRFELTSQLCKDYRHYPEDIENGIIDDTGMCLRYGYIINEVIFLYGGTSVDWNIVNIYKGERDMVADGAVPATPAEEIPELDDVIYRISWHHDGSSHEELFFRGEHYEQHVDYPSGKESAPNVFAQVTHKHDWIWTNSNDWYERLRSIIDESGLKKHVTPPPRGEKTRAFTFYYKYHLNQTEETISGSAKIQVTEAEHAILRDAKENHEDIYDIIELEDVVCDLVKTIETETAQSLSASGLWTEFCCRFRNEMESTNRGHTYKAFIFGVFFLEIYLRRPKDD